MIEFLLVSIEVLAACIPTAAHVTSGKVLVTVARYASAAALFAALTTLAVISTNPCKIVASPALAFAPEMFWVKLFGVVPVVVLVTDCPWTTWETIVRNLK